MNLTVTTNTQLNVTQWQTALNLFAVLPIEPRCFLCHAGKQFHDTPDEFLHRPQTWDARTNTYRLESWYDFTIRFAINGRIQGRIEITNAHDLAIVREGLQFALQTLYTRANRRRWECDDLRRRAALRLDETTAEHYLAQQRQEADIAFTHYDQIDPRRAQRRHDPGVWPLSTHAQWDELFAQLAKIGEARRTTPPPNLPILSATDRTGLG